MSTRPLFCLQILLLTLSMYGRAEEPGIQNTPRSQFSYRVISSDCRAMDTAVTDWSDSDEVCIHTVDRTAPDVISHFVSIRKQGETTRYFLANPVYTEYKLGQSSTLPSITYLLISLDEERVGVGSIDFVFQTVRDLENFEVFFVTGYLPSRHGFVSRQTPGNE